MVNKIKRPLDNYLGLAKVARRLSLTERLVIARLGSVQNVGELVWRNIETAKDYFLRHGVPEDKMIDALNGMDVHSAIEIVQLKKGDTLTTSMVLPPGKNVEDLTDAELRNLVPGEWFVKSGGGVGKESVGLAHGVRQPVHFEVQEPISILKSKAASVDDFWTDRIQRELGHPGLKSGPGTKRKPQTELEYDTQAKQLKVRPAKDKHGKTRPGAERQTSIFVGRWDAWRRNSDLHPKISPVIPLSRSESGDPCRQISREALNQRTNDHRNGGHTEYIQPRTGRLHHHTEGQKCLRRLMAHRIWPHNQSVNRRWLAFRFFNVVSFVYNSRLPTSNPLVRQPGYLVVSSRSLL